MMYEIINIKAFDKQRSIKVTTSQETIRKVDGLEGELEIRTNKSGKQTTVHYIPKENGVYHAVHGSKRYPLHGAISLLDGLDPRPFGQVMQMGQYALVKAFNQMSHEVELHYLYKGVCVDVVAVAPQDVPKYPTYVSPDGVIPEPPIEVVRYINKTLKSLG